MLLKYWFLYSMHIVLGGNDAFINKLNTLPSIFICYAITSIDYVLRYSVGAIDNLPRNQSIYIKLIWQVVINIMGILWTDWIYLSIRLIIVIMHASLDKCIWWIKYEVSILFCEEFLSFYCNKNSIFCTI